MKRFFALALVACVAQIAALRAQTAPQSDVVKADEAITKALVSGDKAAAEKMLDADFSWIDPDGVYYATRGEAFAHGVKPLVGTGADVKVLEHRYGKLVYVERSEGEKKFSGHFWAQRGNGWKLLHINDLEVRPRDYQTVPTTFNVPCTNPCHVLPYKPLGAGEKSALEAWQEQESGAAGWGKRVADNLDQRAVNTYGGRSASKKDRFAGMTRAAQQNTNRPQVGAAPVAYGRAWDFGDSVLWVQLQPTYGDKPYWSSRVYANINGLWQMAESYHTYIKDAPVMAPVPESATKKGATNSIMTKHASWTCCALAIAASAAAQGAPKTYEIKATPTTTFYRFLDAATPPVVTINSGDIVKLETATGTPGYFERLGVPKDKIPAELYETFKGADNDGARRDHTLTGPIYVTGAEPGDSIEIRLRAIDLRVPIGGQGIGGNAALAGEFTPRDKIITLDLKNKTAEYQPGVVVPLTKPFWGSIAVVPPSSVGRITDQRPGPWGANMDNRDLVAGTTLYLPVFVRGALLSLGDGHAAQGQGEVGGSAIETSLKGEIQVVLHKGKTLKLPRAETPTEFMTMGFHEDLDEAVKIATREMLDWIVEMKGIPRDEAYLLASVAMDLRVTQVVDGAKGIHAVIPKSIFRK